MTPALFLGALTSIQSRVDRDQGQLQWGTREWTLSSEVFSALCSLVTAQRMLSK
jgi:hypothetical protein